MRTFLLLSFVLAIAHCQDYTCPKGKSKPKKIMLSPGDSYTFNTNNDGDTYFPKTKCAAIYKAHKKCKDGIRFSCDGFDLPNRDAKRCRKGDRLMLGKKAFCKDAGPDPVTLTGKAAKKGLRVMFMSDKKLQGDGAQCTAVCLDGAAATTTAPTTTSVVERVSLADFPLAQCNNGDPAVYYRPEVEDGDQPPKKILIYLKGGGVCFPNADDFKSCDYRCQNNAEMCSAKTDPTMNLANEKLYQSIFSPDEDINPAFYDFAHLYVPYCSSDLYSGTRNASAETNGRVFYGKHIMAAIIDDLIADNWIQQAEKVVLIGTSAGGSGVFLNCDMVAEKIQAASSSSPDVKCVADGPFSPQAALLDDLDCSDNSEANINFYEQHGAVMDQSCMDQASDPSICASLALSYSYISTPLMVLGSSTDTNSVKNLCSVCGVEKCTDTFLQTWRESIDQQAREMITAKPNWGVSLVNCLFHVLLGNNAYNYDIPAIDGAAGEELTTRELMGNFINSAGAKQGIDNMASLNNGC